MFGCDATALLEMHLSAVRPASEEAMTVLEEVIMFTFQQCVYYITKVSLTILPQFSFFKQGFISTVRYTCFSF